MQLVVNNDKLKKYSELGRSYMFSVGIDGKIRFAFYYVSIDD